MPVINHAREVSRPLYLPDIPYVLTVDLTTWIEHIICRTLRDAP